MLALSQHYFPIFEEALERHGLPLELRYLPVIESALNNRAVSHMGAAGLWQFMPATGRAYGLEINSLIDERLDPIKSSDAAARYLRALYRIYGDWNLVLAAYNTGMGNVNRAIRRSGGRRDYWEIHPFLARETRSFVPVFIGAAYAMNFAAEHNICPAVITRPLAMDTIVVNERIHFEQIASVLDIPIELIRTLNPQYRRDIIPGDLRPFVLRLPFTYTMAFVEHRDSILAYRADELVHNRRAEVEAARGSTATGGTGTIHVVRSGETLGHIARQHGTTAARIAQLNGITTRTIIRPGQRLRVR
jgi:membrane-bound lytic murein transglycosylase D